MAIEKDVLDKLLAGRDLKDVFAKLKHCVRYAQPRSVEATWRKIGELLHIFAPEECANYLVNSGYASV